MSGPIRSMKRQSRPKPQSHKAWKELYQGICVRISEKENEDGEIQEKDESAVMELLEIKHFMDQLAETYNLG